MLLYYAVHGLRRRDFSRGRQMLHITAWDDSPELHFEGELAVELRRTRSSKAPLTSYYTRKQSPRSSLQRNDTSAALNMRADEGEVRCVWSSARMQGAGRNVRSPRKPRRPAPSSGTIPTCEGPGATPPGIEPGSPWRDASSLTTTPPRPLLNMWITQTGANGCVVPGGARGGNTWSSAQVRAGPTGAITSRVNNLILQPPAVHIAGSGCLFQRLGLGSRPCAIKITNRIPQWFSDWLHEARGTCFLSDWLLLAAKYSLLAGLTNVSDGHDADLIRTSQLFVYVYGRGAEVSQCRLLAFSAGRSFVKIFLSPIALTSGNSDNECIPFPSIRRNETGDGKREIPEKTRRPATSSAHDSHLRKSGSEPEIRPGTKEKFVGNTKRLVAVRNKLASNEGIPNAVRMDDSRSIESTFPMKEDPVVPLNQLTDYRMLRPFDSGWLSPLATWRMRGEITVDGGVHSSPRGRVVNTHTHARETDPSLSVPPDPRAVPPHRNTPVLLLGGPRSRNLPDPAFFHSSPPAEPWFRLARVPPDFKLPHAVRGKVKVNTLGCWCRCPCKGGGAAVDQRLELSSTSDKGESGSIPGEVAPRSSYVGIVSDGAVGRLPFPTTLHSGAAPCSPPRDLDVRRGPNDSLPLTGQDNSFLNPRLPWPTIDFRYVQNLFDSDEAFTYGIDVDTATIHEHSQATEGMLGDVPFVASCSLISLLSTHHLCRLGSAHSFRIHICLFTVEQRIHRDEMARLMWTSADWLGEALGCGLASRLPGSGGRRSDILLARAPGVELVSRLYCRLLCGGAEGNWLRGETG
ncbi:hypothetical protein PR048_014281 [Dryococelus australis]|uniref:Uncharacterized protein n=1 Tax=Dryococelus australis TaxID=614101 RepID=A0ABQ9HE67_9NEOP|nr:hypothetical protein PR048_014281 [Dryococelus australis]